MNAVETFYEFDFTSKDLGEIQLSVYPEKDVGQLDLKSGGGLLRIGENGKDLIAIDNLVIKGCDVKRAILTPIEDMEAINLVMKNGSYIIIYGDNIIDAITKGLQEHLTQPELPPS